MIASSFVHTLSPSDCNSQLLTQTPTSLNCRFSALTPTLDLTPTLGGILESDCGTEVDHGVLLVGYGSDPATGTNYWKIKNSYGQDWGMGGYALLERGKPGPGECGLDTSPLMSYPVLA